MSLKLGRMRTIARRVENVPLLLWRGDHLPVLAYLDGNDLLPTNPE